MKKIVIVAGDKSGDIYGGFLCKKLKEKYHSLEIISFGGSHLAQHSQQKIDLTEHAVSGLFEVLRTLPRILKLFKETLRQINEIKPDLVITIDFPDFNMRLIRALNKRFPVFYYISPQVWAWRKGRVATLKEYVDKMIVIFKFEEAFYKKEGMDVLYFGHPLLEIITTKPAACKKIISFMPGSRKNEIARHLPLMIAAMDLLKKKLPDHSFRIIRPSNIEKGFYTKVFPDIEVVDHSYQALAESAFIITSSGTATVEIAILEVPFLIIYKVNALTWRLLKGLVDTKFAGMVNILAQRMVIRELLQSEASPKKISGTALEYLTDEAKYNRLKGELKEIKKIVSPYGATEKFAQYIADYLRLSAQA